MTAKKFYQVVSRDGCSDDARHETLEAAVEIASDRARSAERDYYVTETVRLVKTQKAPVEVETVV
jgi:predicted nucleic acid-binding protein